jgi:hypothetical protein
MLRYSLLITKKAQCQSLSLLYRLTLMWGVALTACVVPLLITNHAPCAIHRYVILFQLPPSISLLQSPHSVYANTQFLFCVETRAFPPPDCTFVHLTGVHADFSCWGLTNTYTHTSTHTLPILCSYLKTNRLIHKNTCKRKHTHTHTNRHLHIYITHHANTHTHLPSVLHVHSDRHTHTLSHIHNFTSLM